MPYADIRLHLISPPELALPDDIIELLRAAGHKVHEFNDMAEGIQGVDILYVTHSGTISVTAGGGSLSRAVPADQAVYTQNCAPNTVIMHPLPEIPVLRLKNWTRT